MSATNVTPVQLLYLKLLAFLFVAVWRTCSGLICYCAGHCPGDLVNGTCLARHGSQCFSAIEEVYDPDSGKVETEQTYGCLPPEESGFMQCKGHLVPHQTPKSIACCDNADLCNQRLKPMFQVTPATPNRGFPGEMMSFSDDIHELALCVSLVVCFLIVIVLLLFAVVRYRKKEERRRSYLTAVHCDGYIRGGDSQKDLINHSLSSGSGAGLPLLVQRTIAKQIELVKSVGRGRFGEVWKARWRSENVAVKVFFTSEEGSWRRETEIYQTVVLLRHENVLGFIAADIRATKSGPQLLLITDYHENGSLFEYLKVHVLDEKAMLALAFSASCGLSHLHTEIFGKQGKPAIAHRDIKSKNILVKRDGTCAIGDFGLAVKYNSSTKEVEVPCHGRIPTKRYMPPEVLEDKMDSAHFDSYKMADMYSFGLVLWEIARRCATNGIVEDYQMPYQEYVPLDPTLDDMKRVVCILKVRPLISNRWTSSEALQTVSKVMQECWHQSPVARLTALRVKKTLSKMEIIHEKKPV